MSRPLLAVAMLAGLLAASPVLAAEPNPPNTVQSEPAQPAPQSVRGTTVIAVVGEGWG
jgi:hypothetical protein